VALSERERVCAVRFFETGVAALIEQELDHFNAASVSSLRERRASVAASDVDVHALVQ
jgi:hypothetical protein